MNYLVVDNYIKMKSSEKTAKLIKVCVESKLNYPIVYTQISQHNILFVIRF